MPSQGYLAHRKRLPRRTLPEANAIFFLQASPFLRESENETNGHSPGTSSGDYQSSLAAEQAVVMRLSFKDSKRGGEREREREREETERDRERDRERERESERERERQRDRERQRQSVKD